MSTDVVPASDPFLHLILSHLSLMGAHGTKAPDRLSQGLGAHKADSDLVTVAQAGDTGAFEELVRRHQKRVLNIAYRMIGNYEDACDIVQESFLSAYRSIKRFRKEAAFSTWLCTICLNHARNRLKQTRSRSRHEVRPPDERTETEESTSVREMPADCPSVIERMERKELQEKVQECMNRLDDDFREVLVLRDIQGFSYEEIADILKVADGTVKSRLFRARDALKEGLKKALGEL